jgi:putative flippase GtrA
MNRPLFEQALRFGAIGTAASAAHVAIALTLIERASLPVLTANGLAFMVAVLVSYIGNHSWTFTRVGHHERHLPRFLAISLVGLALNQAIVFATVTMAGLPYLVGILIVIAVVPVLTFVLSRSWAFIEFRSRAAAIRYAKGPDWP